MSEKISVIVPIYNAEKYLEICLNSIIHQTYKNIEIILINDGSNDNSEKICERYKNNDERIIYIKQENKGVSSARNLGVELSSGEYILFVDADDYLELNMIENLYNNAIEYNCDISICNYKITDNFIIYQTENVSLKKNKLTKKEFVINMLSNKYYKGYLWNKLIKKEVIQNIRFDVDLHVMEDLIFLLSISSNVHSVYYDDMLILYNYVQNQQSVLHNFSKKHFSGVKSYEIILDYIDENNLNIIDEDYYMYIWNYLFIFMNYYYYLYKENKITIDNIDKKKYIRKLYLKKALSRKRNIAEKIKLIITCYFPISIGKCKEILRSKNEKNRNINNK